MSNFLQAVVKLMLGGMWVLLALMTWMWGYAIFKSIGRLRTDTDAGEFLTPNDADVYPLFFLICAFLLVLVTVISLKVRWPWPSYD
ncbi:hypothetical protein [Hymenobacter negativus]|uniref:Uncharacterized protein n=1 Tax=Hymenobacter negativus TaxID=2795026 RepID=A0ABS0Q6Y7_9BACT|nr:hypothetical protein [Hymenobacter negativus]MBH8558413.1 hypothetical protein [Hymenobacter negativus]